MFTIKCIWQCLRLVMNTKLKILIIFFLQFLCAIITSKVVNYYFGEVNIMMYFLLGAIIGVVFVSFISNSILNEIFGKKND